MKLKAWFQKCLLTDRHLETIVLYPIVPEFFFLESLCLKHMLKYILCIIWELAFVLFRCSLFLFMLWKHRAEPCTCAVNPSSCVLGDERGSWQKKTNPPFSEKQDKTSFLLCRLLLLLGICRIENFSFSHRFLPDLLNHPCQQRFMSGP